MSLSLEDKSHLLRRTCFSASDKLVDENLAITEPEQLIDWVLSQPLEDSTYPDWYTSPVNLRDFSQDERKTMRRDMTKSLQQWWQQLLLSSNSPLYEQMVLFWHNHFVSSIQKVKSPYLMLKQNDLFRTQGLTNFKTLLASVLKDPAMLIYLDNTNNKKEAPNENLARELLELFTLGEGNYTETDIKEIARALTGATVNKRTGEYVFRRQWHDSGEKTIFGSTDNYSVDDLAELIVSQPSCSQFITTKFWHYFIDSDPISTEIERLSQLFVDNNYDIKILLKALFLTDAFWQSQGKLIKSPIQLIVGTYRQFELTDLNSNHWRGLTKKMGQLLFSPPNVKGWPGGKSWYASAAIFYRELFVDKFMKKHLPLNLSTSKAQLFSVDPVAEIPAISNNEQLTLAMADPAYQVQ